MEGKGCEGGKPANKETTPGAAGGVCLLALGEAERAGTRGSNGNRRWVGYNGEKRAGSEGWPKRLYVVMVKRGAVMRGREKEVKHTENESGEVSGFSDAEGCEEQFAWAYLWFQVFRRLVTSWRTLYG